MAQMINIFRPSVTAGHRGAVGFSASGFPEAPRPSASNCREAMEMARFKNRADRQVISRNDHWRAMQTAGNRRAYGG
jgi:hypothetical protein